jgi:hypothetical protein
MKHKFKVYIFFLCIFVLGGLVLFKETTLFLHPVGIPIYAILGAIALIANVKNKTNILIHSSIATFAGFNSVFYACNGGCGLEGAASIMPLILASLILVLCSIYSITNHFSLKQKKDSKYLFLNFFSLHGLFYSIGIFVYACFELIDLADLKFHSLERLDIFPILTYAVLGAILFFFKLKPINTIFLHILIFRISLVHKCEPFRDYCLSPTLHRIEYWFQQSALHIGIILVVWATTLIIKRTMEKIS